MSTMPKKHAPIENNQRGFLFDDLSFAASEAYKLLRTNLMFSVPETEESSCKAIGITSSTRGEGKSTTALNLSYTIAQTNQRVLLVDADMRLPTVASRLAVARRPGLSDFLAGQCSLNDVIQPSHVLDSFFVISAGTIPPNPSELLGSDNMKKALTILRNNFDFIIFDLPPVMIVSDALVLSPLLDGVILAVRQDYVTRKAVSSTVRMFDVQKSKLLGFVVTNAKDVAPRYKKYKSENDRTYKYGYSAGSYSHRSYAASRRVGSDSRVITKSDSKGNTK